MSEQESHLYEFGPYRLDAAEGVLWRGDEPVRLDPKAFEMLRVLVERGGHVVGKEEFFNEVWPGTFVEESSLTKNIHLLRKALGEGPSGQRYIETVPKRGYRFVAGVRKLGGGGAGLVPEKQTVSRVDTEEEAVDDAPAFGATPERGALAGGEGRWGGRGAALILLAACVALAGLLAARYYLRVSGGPKQPESASAISSIAVLPFKTVGAEGADEYLSLGLADALITRLSSLKQIAVRPTSAVRKYADSAQDLAAAGRELGVDAVLDGNVQRAGERIRVTVQLVGVRDGRPFWAETFDGRFTDIFAAQDALTEKITAALKVRLTAAERERLYRRYTENVAAYDLYLRGRSRLLSYTKDGTLGAVEDFEGALRLDPGYALAHAGLALASAQMRIRFAPESEVKLWEERAEQAARRALGRDPNLAEAHEAMAAVYRHAEFNWEQTIEESRRALDLNPNLDQPHHYLAVAFFHLGLPELVEEEARAGARINPSNRLDPLRVRGATALVGGRYAEAAAMFEEARGLSEAPVTDWYLAQAYYYQGERERAEAMLAGLGGGAQAEQRAKATLASFTAARGRRAQAESLLRDALAGTYMDHHVAYAIGATYAQLGERAPALKWLSRAVETGLPCYPWYERDPLLDPLRGDPEFQRFLAELRKSWGASKARYTPST